MLVKYCNEDVLTAARARVSLVFDEFDRIVVSVSGGKDSTVLLSLVHDEARRRGREIEVFFLDQEAEYQSTIDVIRWMMTLPGVRPRWFQVPIRMTNATSATDVFLTAWGENETWLRDKDPLAITAIKQPYPDRFYQFFEWYEKQQDGRTAFFVGLRSQESLNRFRSVTANPGYKGIGWSTAGKGEAFRFYPIFDWTFGDIWKYIADTGLPYNRLYDRLFMLEGLNISTMRVSNLIHEKAFKALATLQDFEPDTYDRLVRRLGGVHCAALYAKDEQVYSANKRPAAFPTWRAYRDYLLSTTPGEEIRARYERRFSGQPTDEATCQQQVKQILINDWENNVPVMRQKAARLREVWWNRL